jgi:hypothetical protein
VNRWLNGLVLVGKGRANGGSIDVDFNDDALYAPILDSVVFLALDKGMK